MRRFLTLILAFALCVSLLAGCGGNGNNGQTQEENIANSDSNVTDVRATKDTLTVVLSGEPPTLDPAKGNNNNIGIVNRFVLEALWDSTADGDYEYWLAEETSLEGDTTLHIKLKDDIYFSDGTQLTAEDVLWHYLRTAADPISTSQFGFIDPDKSYVVDDLNLVIEFKQAWAPYIPTFAAQRGLIPSKAHFEKVGEAEYARGPVGSGPYKVQEWVSGSYITLVPNEYYHGGEPNFKTITIKFIQESTARVIEMETGAADVVYDVQASDISRVEALDGYHIVQGDSYTYYILCLSMQEPLFQDINVRKALFYAIDQEALVNSSTDGTATVIHCFGPPLMKEGTKEYIKPYDVEEAKRLLAEAGYPDGFTIDLHIEPSAIYSRLAGAIQSMWAEIGVTANIVESSLATYEAQNGGKFQASLRNGGATEPSGVWTIYESSFGSRLNGNDDWLDEKLLELRTYYSGDPAREELLEEISDHLDEINFSYPLMVTPTVYGVSDNLEGFEFAPVVMYCDVWNWVLYEN